MILDVTGIELTPGNGGEYCLGNGECMDEKGEWIECCCDVQCCIGITEQNKYKK